VLRQELDIGYLRWIHKPGEELGVFDNASEYDECKRRVHCNCTHGSIAPEPVYNEEKKAYELDKSQMQKKIEDFNSMLNGRRRTIMSISDHNNVYFPDFIRYKTTMPQCLMQDLEGNYLELHDELICDGEGVPMPAIDDPTIIALYSEALEEQARLLKDNQYVAAYLLGFEELYPEYFNLGHGDFRPESWQHFIEWCKVNGIKTPLAKEKVVTDGITSDSMKWYQFREQAMADRCCNYYRSVLNVDENHLAYYPTHGSTFSDTRRAHLGQQASSLACSCDGMEMGHILIENDRERRNVIMISHYTSFGAPVIVPRLGNKQTDLSAIGGGRSFTKETLRRFIYECVGLGIDKIFPIHWSSRLHDGEWFIKDTEAEPECRKVFDELIEASPYLYGMGRLQPQVGILACDATWIENWNPRWTGLLQDAYSNHCSITIVADAIVNKHLSKKMPLLILPDNYRISDDTLKGLNEYIRANGKVIIWGRFGEENEELKPLLKEEIDRFVKHPNVIWEKSPEEKEMRVLRELFLAGPEYGVAGSRFEFMPISFKAIEQAIHSFAPECILKTAELFSEDNLKDVNVYTLTDRTSLVYVFINNAATPVKFNFKPDVRLITDYVLFDVIEGKQIMENIILEANASKMIWVYHEVTENTAERTILKAEKAFEGWLKLGANISAFRLPYALIQSGPNMNKKNALAETLLSSLAIKGDFNTSENGLHANFKIFNSEGKAVSDAVLTFRITPGTFERFECYKQNEEYFCDIPKEKLPTYYDVNLAEYVMHKGRVRLIIEAENDEYQGGCVEHIII